jgi:hypothetical protein
VALSKTQTAKRIAAPSAAVGLANVGLFVMATCKRAAEQKRAVVAANAVSFATTICRLRVAPTSTD